MTISDFAGMAGLGWMGWVSLRVVALEKKVERIFAKLFNGKKRR